MKKFMYLVAMSTLLFACSENDNLAPATEPEAGVTFEISAIEGMKNGADTRSSLYSQEAAQHVTQVVVHAFKDNGTDYVYSKSYTIDNWTDGMTFKRYAVTDKLAEGDYKFLAIGREASDMFTITTPSSTTTFDGMEAGIAQSGDENEIFSGWKQATVTNDGGRVSIDMTRMVAGVLGYFKNIPATINGTPVKYLRLSLTDSNQAVNLTNGTGINGATTAYNLIDMDLSAQPIVNEVYTGNDLSAQGVVKVANSQLSGSYLIPVSGIQITLGLYDAGGNPLKSWVVKDSNGDATFNILANHFYSLGTKAQTGNVNGGTPEPGDDDAPIDLLTDQSIVISISPAWTLVHDLVIQ